MAVTSPEAKERKRAYWRAYAKRKYHEERLAKFNLTQSDYDALFAAQGGVCAICGDTGSDGREHTLCIDHDHGTGEVRGLLCHNCNLALGHLEDDIERVLAAAQYLAASRKEA